MKCRRDACVMVSYSGQTEIDDEEQEKRRLGYGQYLPYLHYQRLHAYRIVIVNKRRCGQWYDRGVRCPVKSHDIFQL